MATLPGGVTIARVRQQEVAEPLRTLVTLPKARPLRYCQVVLDRHQRIVEVLVLTEGPIELRNLARLVGVQEAFANSLVHAFESGAVTDFLSFFRQDWAYALYHHRFPLFREQLIQLTKVDAGALGVLSKIRQVVEYSRDMKKGEEDDSSTHDMVILKRNELVGQGGHALPPSTRSNLSSSILRFVEANKKELRGMYYIKGLSVADMT